jgi:hypothetical protein
MRTPLPAAALFLVALTAAAPKPGDRTAAPGEVLGSAAAADPLAEVEAIAAAAAAHPLGSLANPVRVGGPEGARAYIARLRCADGSQPEIGAAAAGGVGAYGSVTRVYPLDCGRAAPGRLSLVVDLYHEEHREDRAPAGLSMAAR